MSRFQCSSVVSSSGVGGCSIPALLIALSRRPKPSMVAVTARARSPEFATLQTTGLCATPSSFYQSGGFSQAFFVDGSEGDIGSGIGEREGGGASDAVACPGDERDLTGEIRCRHESALPLPAAGA